MSIVNLLKYVDLITLLLPLIEKIITMVESLFNKFGSNSGTKKKSAVKKITKTILSGYELSLPEEVIDKVIDSVVEVKNQTGEFTHGGS